MLRRLQGRCAAAHLALVDRDTTTTCRLNTHMVFLSQEEARQKAAAEAAKEAAAAEAERRRKDALPHISEKQPPPKWLLTAAADAFDETTGELKLQRRRFVDGNADFAVGGASAGDDSDEDLVDVIPDRFFQLPSEIDFRDSHLVQNSRCVAVWDQLR